MCRQKRDTSDAVVQMFCNRIILRLSSLQTPGLCLTGKFPVSGEQRDEKSRRHFPEDACGRGFR